MYYNAYELYHHGIKGQKWGIRRFQNRDGTYTNAGKRRRNEDGDSDAPRSSSGVGKKIAAGLGIAAAVGVSAAVLANPNARRYILSFADKSANSLKAMVSRNAPKVKEYIKERGQKTIKSLGKRFDEAGEKMVDAALASIGTVAIAKVTANINTGNADLDQVLRDTSTAGIKSFTNTSNSSNKQQSKEGGSVGAEISSKIGAPNKKPVDKNGADYQSLFKDSNGNNRDADTRSVIKSMINAGYGIDQAKEYIAMLDRGEIKHGDIEMFKPILSTYIGLAYTASLLAI